MIVAGALFSANFSIPGLRVLGDASYSLYLTHVVTLAAMGQIWAAGLQNLGAPPFVISAPSLHALSSPWSVTVFWNGRLPPP